MTVSLGLVCVFNLWAMLWRCYNNPPAQCSERSTQQRFLSDWSWSRHSRGIIWLERATVIIHRCICYIICVNMWMALLFAFFYPVRLIVPRSNEILLRKCDKHSILKYFVRRKRKHCLDFGLNLCLPFSYCFWLCRTYLCSISFSSAVALENCLNGRHLRCALIYFFVSALS